MASAATKSAEHSILRVGPQSKQTGDLVHDGVVIVEGAVTGRIHAREVRVLTHGTVDASIHADIVKIMGTVRGSVKCETLLVGATSQVHDADVQCEKIGIEPGSQYNASTRTLRPNAIPRFDYDAAMARLSPNGIRPARREGLGTVHPGFSVVEGGAGRPSPFDVAPVSAEDRVHYAPRA